MTDTRADKGWNYTEHPGDCHPVRKDGVWTTCCRECAGTGVFPVPWIQSATEGKADPDASCVACKATGRSVVGLAAPGTDASGLAATKSDGGQ